MVRSPLTDPGRITAVPRDRGGVRAGLWTRGGSPLAVPARSVAGPGELCAAQTLTLLPAKLDRSAMPMEVVIFSKPLTFMVCRPSEIW